MEAVYLNRPWRWGFGKRGWDLKFRPTADTVSVSSIEEVAGSCTINVERTLARMKLYMKRNPLKHVDLDAALTCQTESTYSLSGEGITSYKWSVSGDVNFQQGTDVTGSSVIVQSDSDKSVRFIVMCTVNGVLQVYQEFRHQRWITSKLVPTKTLLPSDELLPGDLSVPTPVN